MASDLSPDEWFIFHDNQEEHGDLSQHPKDERFLFSTNDLSLPSTYSSMMTWVDMYVTRHMQTSKSWSTGRVYPRRTAYLWGAPGTGRATYVAAQAKKNKINFLYVPYYFYSFLRVRKAITLAREKAPCILYFADADGMLSEEHTIRHLNACVSADLSLYDPVWVLFGGVVDPLSLPQSARSFLEKNGDIVVVPPPSSTEHQSSIPLLLKSIAGVPDYPPRELNSEWNSAIFELSRCANNCTFGEVRHGLNRMFQQFRALVPGGNPTPEFIQNFIQTLSITSEQPQRRTFFVDAQLRANAFAQGKPLYVLQLARPPKDVSSPIVAPPTPVAAPIAPSLMAHKREAPPATHALVKRDRTKPIEKGPTKHRQRTNALKNLTPITENKRVVFLEP